MKKVINLLLLLLGGLFTSTLVRKVTLNMVAGRSLTEYVIGGLVWLILSIIFLLWSTSRWKSWPLTLGCIWVFSGGVLFITSLFITNMGSNINLPTGPISIEFRLVGESNNGELHAMKLRGTDEILHLGVEELLSERDIESANARWDSYSSAFYIVLNFTREGSNKLDRITTINIGRRLGIVVDKVLLCAPSIRSRISSGRVNISANFSNLEANIIVHRINKEIDLLQAKKPSGIIAGLLLLMAGFTLVLRRNAIKVTGIRSIASIILLILGAFCIVGSLIEDSIRIFSGLNPEFIPSLLFISVGAGFIRWGVVLSHHWRLSLGVICSAMGAWLIFSALVLFPVYRKERGYMGFVIISIGTLLIIKWVKRRRIDLSKENRVSRNSQ